MHFIDSLKRVRHCRIPVNSESNAKQLTMQSVAEHSFSLSHLAMLFGQRHKLKESVQLRLIQLALVHDDHKAVSGQPLTNNLFRSEYEHRKKLSIQMIRDRSGEDGKFIRRLWRQYAKGKDEAVLLLRQLHELDLCYQAYTHYQRGELDGSFENILLAARQQIKDPRILPELDQLSRAYKRQSKARTIA